MDQIEVEKLSEPRFISAESMQIGQSVNESYEDDVLNGGDLLDTFSTNPVQYCEVHLVDNPWLGEGPEDLDNDELLDLFIPDEHTSNLDDSLLQKPSNLTNQFLKESNNLFGDSSIDMVELIQDLLLTEEGETGLSVNEILQHTDDDAALKSDAA